VQVDGLINLINKGGGYYREELERGWTSLPGGWVKEKLQGGE